MPNIDDRGQRRDRDDDYDDARAARLGADGPKTGLQLGLGIAALVLGIVGAIFAIIPLCGAYVALPACGVGLILGIVGLIVAMNKKAGYGLPIAGTAVSVAGLALAIYWWLAFAAAVSQVNRDLQNIKDNPLKDIQIKFK